MAGRAQTLRRRKHLAAGVVTPSATSTYLRDPTYPPPRRITTRSSAAEIHSRGLRKLTRYSTNNRRRCRAREHPEEGGYRRPQRFTMMLPMPGCRLRRSRGFFAVQGMYAHPRGRACSPRCVRSDRFPARSHAASQPGVPACSVCTFPTSTRSKMPTATPPSRQPMPHCRGRRWTFCDGIEAGRMSTPRLTTVQQPMVRLGRAAMRVMRSCPDDPSQPPIAVRLPVRVLLRESSKGVSSAC